MKTVYIVANCFNEEFHDLVTDANNIKGVFLTKEAAEAHVKEYFSCELANEALDRDEDKALKNLPEYDMNKIEDDAYNEARGLEIMKIQENLAKKHGFLKYSDAWKYRGVYVRIFETILFE